MTWILSFLPHHWLEQALLDKWIRAVPRDDGRRLVFWYELGALRIKWQFKPDHQDARIIDPET